MTIKPRFLARLQQMDEHAKSLGELLMQPNIASDQEQFRRIRKEYADLEPIVALFHRYLDISQEMTIVDTMLSDPSIKGLAEEELRSLLHRQEEIELSLDSALLPVDSNDERNIFLEIRAGTGGEESALFAGQLLRMYLRYAERHRWSTEIISMSESDLGGYREAVVRIIGSRAWAHLKFESGGHRVQRVPETEAQGRIHTSACTIAVMPEAATIDISSLKEVDLRVDVFRASGAGGQHVNKTESAVRITHLPTGLVAECQDNRSQHQNRERAMAVLIARVRDQERRAQQAEQAATRKSLIGSGDRSERIRTYNFPQGRVTDHRIGLTLYKIAAVMDGDLDEIINGLRAEHRAQQLAEISEPAEA